MQALCLQCSRVNEVEQSHCQGCGQSLRLNDRYSVVRSLSPAVSGLSNPTDPHHHTYLGLDWNATPPLLCVLQDHWRLEPGISPRNRCHILDRLCQLAPHPQLPIVLDQFEAGGRLYGVQAYRRGKNLAQWLQDQDTVFSLSQIAIVLGGVLPLLEWIHAQGWVHGDVKPQNILISGADLIPEALVLVDWGNARYLNDPPDWTTVPPVSPWTPAPEIPSQRSSVGYSSADGSAGYGSAEYAAPEQLTGQVDFASDLYSLGVTCIYLLTGISPFQLWEDESSQWAWRSFYPGEWSPELRSLAALLDQLIELNPLHRLTTATETIDQLSKISKVSKTTRPAWTPRLESCQFTLRGHRGHSQRINSVAFSSQQPLLASGSDDRTVRLWNYLTGELLAVLTAHQKPVKSVVFDPQQNHLATGGNDRRIYLWDLADLTAPLLTLTGHQHHVQSLSYGTCGLLASGSTDKTIKLWNRIGQCEPGDCPHTLGGHRLGVNAVAFSSPPRWLASGSSDATVKIWDFTPPPTLITTLTGHTAAVNTIAFNPSTTLLATAGDDRTIQLWDTDTWKRSHLLSAHSWPISTLVFSGDGRYLLSASWDKTVKIWDMSSGKEWAILQGHTDSVTALAIDFGGQWIATGSQDHTLKLWRMP